MSQEPVDNRTVRGFTWVMLAAAALGAVALARRGASLPLALAPVAATLALVVVGLVAPRSLVGVYRAWMALGEAIGKVTTPVILFAVFVLVLIPTRLLLAIARKDPMTRRCDRRATTYWSERERRSFARDDFERLW